MREAEETQADTALARRNVTPWKRLVGDRISIFYAGFASASDGALLDGIEHRTPDTAAGDAVSGAAKDGIIGAILSDAAAGARGGVVGGVLLTEVHRNR